MNVHVVFVNKNNSILAIAISFQLLKHFLPSVNDLPVYICINIEISSYKTPPNLIIRVKVYFCKEINNIPMTVHE